MYYFAFGFSTHVAGRRAGARGAPGGRRRARAETAGGYSLALENEISSDLAGCAECDV